MFSLCEFGHSGVLIVWYLCSVPNLVQICYSHWDRRTYAADLHLMTSRELTSGFDFWLRSSTHGRDACHIIWCKIPLSSPELLTFFRNSRWRPPPSCIFSLWIWPFRRVDSVVFVFCIKFGWNICYSHWGRRTYASDLRLMTSRELTSGFDFWSRVHLCMAVMHLPMKFGADIFIQSGVIDIFPKLKMVAAAILDLLGWAMRPPTKPRSWCVPPVKILSWSAI